MDQCHFYPNDISIKSRRRFKSIFTGIRCTGYFNPGYGVLIKSNNVNVVEDVRLPLLRYWAGDCSIYEHERITE